MGTAAPYVGLVIDSPTSYSPDFLFADAIRQARAFAAIGGDGYTAPSSGFDANGWPNGDATLFVMEGLSARTINGVAWGALAGVSGTYQFIADGDVRTAVTAVGGTFSNWVYDPIANRTTADFTVPSPPLNVVQFTFQGIPGGVKNVKLIRPGYTEADLFTTSWLERLAHFSTLRTLDFTRTNNNNVAEWTDRTRPSYASQSARSFGGKAAGIAWEYFIRICNQLGKDAWINVPVKASDDYITKLAQLFRYGSDATGTPYTSPQVNPVHPPLDPSLKLYLEYSNELWNWGFQQTAWNRDEASYEAALPWVSGQSYLGSASATRNGSDVYQNTSGVTYSSTTPPESDPAHWKLIRTRTVDDPHHLRWDGSTDQVSWIWRRAAARLVDISNSFRSVFGDAAMVSRVRPVIAVQTANASISGNMVRYVDHVWGPANPYGNPQRPVNQVVWGLAATTYTYVDDTQGNLGTTPTLDAYFTQINNRLQTDTVGWMTAQNKWAYAYGLEPVCYEGSQHTEGGSTMQQLNIDAQYDGRMKDWTVAMYQAWFGAGGKLHCYSGTVFPFGPSTGGAWGLGEWCDREDEPGPSGPWARRQSYADAGGTPKWAAVKEVLAGDVPALAVGTQLPAVLNPTAYILKGTNGTVDASTFTLRSLDTERDIAWWVRSTNETAYWFKSTLTGTGTVAIDVDGVPVATWSGAGDKAEILRLSAGLHGVRVRLTSGTTATLTALAITVAPSFGTSAIAAEVFDPTGRAGIAVDVEPNPRARILSVRQRQGSDASGSVTVTLDTMSPDLTLDIYGIMEGADLSEPVTRHVTVLFPHGGQARVAVAIEESRSGMALITSEINAALARYGSAALGANIAVILSPSEVAGLQAAFEESFAGSSAFALEVEGEMIGTATFASEIIDYDSLTPTMKPVVLALGQRRPTYNLELPKGDAAVIPFRIQFPDGRFFNFFGSVRLTLTPSANAGPFDGTIRATDPTFADIQVPDGTLTSVGDFDAAITSDGPGTQDRHTLPIRLKVLDHV